MPAAALYGYDYVFQALEEDRFLIDDTFSPARRRRQIRIALSGLLIGLCWWRVLAPQSGLVIRSLERDGVPMRFMAPDRAGQVPGVLIAHGFGVSQQIMRAYGYALAHGGYGVMLLDFDGHGANQAPFIGNMSGLQRDLEAAYAELISQPEINGRQTGLLGHSMGSGVVMQAGIENPQRYQATVAVSPTEAVVTPTKPPNLLLQVGAWETRFRANAEALLAASGGENGDFAGGRARSLVVVPNSEHILVLFNHFSHQSAIDWFDQAFGMTSDHNYRDRRPQWFLLSLVGWMMLTTGLAPMISAASIGEAGNPRRSWHWLGLLLFPFLASILLSVIHRLTSIDRLGGIMVGGAFGIWFFLMGLGWLLIGFRTPRPSWRDLGWGLLLFISLSLAVGAMTHLVALNWVLVPARLLRWPVMTLAYLPWLLAAGQTQQGAGIVWRIGWWLGHTLIVSAVLLATAYLVPSLSVLILALPLIPLIFAIMTVAAAVVENPWSSAIGNAMFFGWLMMAYFPIVV